MSKVRTETLEIQPRLIPGDMDTLVVTQANSLATSIQDMTLLERRILLLALAVVSRSDTELPYVRIYSSDVRRAFDLNHNSLNAELDAASGRLMTRYAEFLRSRHGSNSKISWVNEVHFTTGQDSEAGMAYIDVQLHPRMAQYVLQLTGNFFRVPFSVLARFRSLYGMRLCEILTAESHAGRRADIYFDLHDLKGILDCDKPSYKNFSNFRQRVLDPAQAENAEVGYLAFEYETVKRGRRVVGLQLRVGFHPENAEEDQLTLEPTDDDVRRVTLENTMRESGFTDSPRPYVDKLGVDLVEKIYKECRRSQTEAHGTKGEIKNFGGFLHARLKVEMQGADAAPQGQEVAGHIHLTGTEIQAAAESFVQELAQERSNYAWEAWEKLPEVERQALKREVYHLDAWTVENIKRQGEDGPTFRGGVRRVLEESTLTYPKRLQSIRAYLTGDALDVYPPQTRQKILDLAVEIE